MLRHVSTTIFRAVSMRLQKITDTGKMSRAHQNKKGKKCMVYLSADTHGCLDLQKVTDFFQTETLHTPLTKKDYLILLGDAGICWDGGKNDAWVKKQLQNLPVTTLWLDGNHENFPLLTEYPKKRWHGGYVHVIAADLLHLMRGYCYEIEGKVFWVFGGGNSVDKACRTQGIDWWPQEMPSEEEYERGRKSLLEHGYQADYMLTHTAPLHVAQQLAEYLLPGEEKLQEYLQDISQCTVFREWYFGHWHMDLTVSQKYHGLMEQVVRIDLTE